MKFKVASNSFVEKQEKIDTFNGIIVNATTLQTLLEAVDGPVTLTLNESKDIVYIWHPYDF
jgi:hypothetical protein